MTPHNITHARERLHHRPVSSPSRIASPSFFSRLWSSIHSKVSLMAKGLVRRKTRKESIKRSQPTSFAQQPTTPADWHDVGQVVTIDALPDDVLLEIFDYYMQHRDIIGSAEKMNAWHTLVHVCRKWRIVVLESPRRLNIRLVCTGGTSVRKMLDIWPPLPIVISGHSFSVWGVDNILAAPEHNNRVCQIELWLVTNSPSGKLLAAMEKPFPALTSLELFSEDETVPVDPDSFLGGSAPRLQSLSLTRIPFPGLRKLLLSATDLVDLELWSIPNSGYISPEAILSCLSALTRLEQFRLGFQSPPSRPVRESRRPPPLTRTLLPALSKFRFKGISEYLEDLVARIDASRLGILDIAFFNQLIFDTPQLAQFISRTPKLKAPDNARLIFHHSGVRVSLYRTSITALYLGIQCRKSDWQLSSMAQVCGSSFPHALQVVPMVEDLDIEEGESFPPHWQDDIENTEWLELLRPFTSVKNLTLCQKFAPRIAPVLQELVGKRVAEVLPALENIYFRRHNPSRPVLEAIGEFVAARQLSGYPVEVLHFQHF